MTKNNVKHIESIIRTALFGFASGFSTRHISEADNPEGVINSKRKNVFMAALPSEMIYYSALVRSFDSSFGTLLENIALEIARMNYEVTREVRGNIDARQLDLIGDILNSYKNYTTTPSVKHYKDYNAPPFSLKEASHKSDHHLYDKSTKVHHLVELKAGGDLDIKKAESEKNALLEQYFILKNSTNEDIELHFATAYNRFGEGNTWNQERVLKFFAREELLIGCEFWNFVCKDEKGFETVINAYNKNADIIIKAFNDIKEAYSL